MFVVADWISWLTVMFRRVQTSCVSRMEFMQVSILISSAVTIFADNRIVRPERRTETSPGSAAVPTRRSVIVRSGRGKMTITSTSRQEELPPHSDAVNPPLSIAFINQRFVLFVAGRRVVDMLGSDTQDSYQVKSNRTLICSGELAVLSLPSAFASSGWT